jgi:hypothetical protein
MREVLREEPGNEVAIFVDGNLSGRLLNNYSPKAR